jgi:hypothetical protein
MDRIEQIVAEAQQRAQDLVDSLSGQGEPDGCDLDFTKDATPDEHLDGVVLFAGVDPEDADAVGDLAEAWRRLGDHQEDDCAS